MCLIHPENMCDKWTYKEEWVKLKLEALSPFCWPDNSEFGKTSDSPRFYAI